MGWPARGGRGWRLRWGVVRCRGPRTQPVGFQNGGIGGWPASMPAVMVAGLARSQARDGTDDLPALRALDWLDGAARCRGVACCTRPPHRPRQPQIPPPSVPDQRISPGRMMWTKFSARTGAGREIDQGPLQFRAALMREASDGSPLPWFMARGATSLFRLAERGQLAVDLGQVERLGFFGVVLAPVLHRGAAFVRHADRVVLAPVARERLLQRDLVLPACPEVIGVADLAGVACHGITQPDRLFVAGLVEVHEPVAVLFLPRLEHVQVVAVPAEQHLDDVVQVAEGGYDWQPHPAPDRRTGAGQRDLQLGHLVDAARLAGGGALRPLLREVRGPRVTRR